MPDSFEQVLSSKITSSRKASKSGFNQIVIQAVTTLEGVNAPLIKALL